MTLNGKHGHVWTSFKQMPECFLASQITIYNVLRRPLRRIIQDSLSDETANQFLFKFHLKKLQNSAMKHETLVIKRNQGSMRGKEKSLNLSGLDSHEGLTIFFFWPRGVTCLYLIGITPEETCGSSLALRFWFHFWVNYLALVVQTLDSAIHRINHYPADKY